MAEAFYTDKRPLNLYQPTRHKGHVLTLLEPSPVTIRPHDGPVFVTPPTTAVEGDLYSIRCAPDSAGWSVVVKLGGRREATVAPGQTGAYRASRSLLNRIWTRLGGKPSLIWVPA